MRSKNDVKITIEIRKWAIRLIVGQISLFLFNILVLLNLKSFIPQVSIWPWKEGIALLTFSVLINLCLFFIAPWLHRVKYLQIFYFLGGAFSYPIYCYLSSTRVAYALFDGFNFYIISTFNLILILYNYVPGRIKQNVTLFEKAETFNIESGKLTADGNWDISKKLLERSPKATEERNALSKRLFRWTYLTPGIAFILSRNVEANGLLLLVCVLGYLAAHIYASISSKSLAVLFYVLKLEKKRGNHIGLVADKAGG